MQHEFWLRAWGDRQFLVGVAKPFRRDLLRRDVMTPRWKPPFWMMLSVALTEMTFVGMAAANSMDELVAAAQKEGELSVIALPRDWCGYGNLIDGFKAKYGLAVNELHPNASSTGEIEAIKANRSSASREAPDVIDVGLSFGPMAKQEELLQPYKVSTWSTIPDSVKDAEGHWFGGYYGVLVFEVNTDIIENVPTDWPDLLKPEYKKSVAFAGNPLGSSQAMQAVFAAGLSSANGRIDQAADEGLKFLAELSKRGNFVPLVGNAESLTRGVTPILIRWDYLALSDRDRLEDNTNIEIVVPKTGIVGGVYVQAISAFAPHPNAAKLWMEYLYSDEGQIAWLSGFCRPVRLKDLMSNGKVPVKLTEGLPQTENGTSHSEPLFPTIEQLERAKEKITQGWDAVVGVKVQKYYPPDTPTH
jgi:putative spermidine/putrescine transport system substrate-binding protein